MFTEQDLQEIENIKQRDTEAILKTVDDCLTIETMIKTNPNHPFLANYNVTELQKSIYVSVKIMLAILKDRGEGIH